MKRHRAFAAATSVAATALLAGCVGGTTYGTGVSQEAQLMEDVTNAISLTPPKREKIAYNPRPTLLEPSNKDVLPPPQASLKDGNPQWPESPEQTRERLRAEADANVDNPFYKPQIAAPSNASRAPASVAHSDRRGRLNKDTEQPSSGNFGNPLNLLASKEKKRQAANERIAQVPDNPSRRYLSDPPVEYQEPIATAPVNDVGIEEKVKEDRRKKLLKAGDKKGWRDYLPF